MKKGYLFSVVLSLVLLITATSSFAQLKGISSGGNVMLPAGDWSDFAKTGYGGSATYEHPLNPKAVGLVYFGYTVFTFNECIPVGWRVITDRGDCSQTGNNYTTLSHSSASCVQASRPVLVVAKRDGKSSHINVGLSFKLAFQVLHRLPNGR